MTIFTLVCMLPIANAQKNGSIEGVVTDANGKPLVGVSVSLFERKDSLLIHRSLTDDNGIYHFSNLSELTYSIAYSSVGYEQGRSAFFTVKNDQKFYCDTIQLELSETKLDAIVINGKKTNFIETKLDKTILNVDASPASAGSSVYEVLEKSPGVYSDKNGNLSLQGKSGVLVMIDGRPTYMSNNDLNTFLKNMPSSEVQSIELIPNPSSKYDAAGNGGVINIKTKKNKNFGTNGTITLGGGYGDYLKTNGGISLNNRTEKLNLFGNYNYSYNKNGRTLSIDREVLKKSGSTFFAQDGIQINENNTHQFRIGADYKLGEQTNIGFLINSNDNFENQSMVNTTLMSNNKTTTDSSLFTDNQFNQEYHNMSYNLNFKTNLNKKGDELSFDADLSKYNSTVNSFFNSYYFDAFEQKLRNPLHEKSFTQSDILIKSLKADYTNQLNADLKLEAGAKTTFIKSDNALSYATLNGTNWQDDPSKSNHFIYDENVWAGYVNASQKWENTSLQIGLRAEYSDTKGNSLTENKIVKRDYLDFFPSVFINQKLSDKHNIGFSYSRRIQRPDYESLNPFIYTIDEYTYQKGNPFLNPEYSHSFALSYLFKNKYMAQFGYSITNDVISQVILIDSTTKALYQTTKNISQQKTLRLTINAPIKISKWWSVNNNFTGIQMSYQSSNLEGQKLDVSQFFVMLNTNHSFKITDGINAELTGKYMSPFLFGTLKLQSQFTLDAGISASLFEKRGSLKLSMSDVLDGKRELVSSVYPGVNYSLNQKMETRVFRLSFSYNFGNRNVKESRKKQTGLEEEQSRLKSK